MSMECKECGRSYPTDQMAGPKACMGCSRGDDYTDAMTALNDAVYAALRAAQNEDGAPADALREMAAEVDHLIDHNCTRAEMADARAIYEGAKLAGLTA